jgi:hypothetical protein
MHFVSEQSACDLEMRRCRRRNTDRINLADQITIIVDCRRSKVSRNGAAALSIRINDGNQIRLRQCGKLFCVPSPLVPDTNYRSPDPLHDISSLLSLLVTRVAESGESVINPVGIINNKVRSGMCQQTNV